MVFQISWEAEESVVNEIYWSGRGICNGEVARVLFCEVAE